MSEKTLPVSFRMQPDMKKALELAAAEDMRSVSSLLEKIISDWLASRKAQPTSAVKS